MFYLVYGIILVVLIAGCVMAAKHWHWVNTVFLILTFLAGVAATVGMAQVFYKRSKAVKALSDITKKHDLVSAQLNEAIYGKPSDIGYGEKSLRGVSNKLNLELLGRGRVWSGGNVASAGEGLWDFKFASAIPEGGDIQLKLLDQIEVQVFRDQVINQRAYPVSYIGEFRIKVKVNEDGTVARDGFQLQGLQIVDTAEAASPTSTWSIYEKMPLDRRGAFKDAIAALSKEGMDVDELSIDQFRQILQTQFFPAEKVPFDVESAQYERLIDSYAFDGVSLGKIQNWVEANQGARKSGAFQPRPEEVQVRYRFNKPSKEYTVDAEGTLAADGPFTALGLAVSRNLHLGKKVTFQEGDEVTIDQLSAEGYQRDGVTIAPFPQTEAVTEIDRIYVRKYRDYPFMFSNLQSQAAKLVEALNERKKNNATHDNAIAKNLQEQIQERIRIQADLDSDNKLMERDRDIIVAAERKKAAEVEALQQEIQQLRDVKISLRRQVGSAAASIQTGAQSVEMPVSTGGGYVQEYPVQEYPVQEYPAFDAATSGREIIGAPIFNEGSSSRQPVYDTPVYESPVYGAPVESLPSNVVNPREPIYSQPREFNSQPVPIEVPPEGAATEIPMLNFTDQAEPRSSIGTETRRSTAPLVDAPFVDAPSVEAPSEESVLEFFGDGN
jgi:23S rRNA pseudoU1915 N3-methylase RlmH